MNSNHLPAGFNLRPAAWTDLEGVSQLIYATLQSTNDTSMAVSPDVLAGQWKTPGFMLETDAWVVTNPDGKIVASEEFMNHYLHASLRGDGYVHPDYTGLGLGTCLLETLDARARQEIPIACPDLRVFLRTGVNAREKNGREIHEACGFKLVRHHWRMEINLEGPPTKEKWPAGVELRPFDLATQDHSVYDAQEEAFRDHWGHFPRTYEHWQINNSAHPDFDPAQWHIAWAGEQIAGFSICRLKEGFGWVAILGVRRPWRRQGLGMALLKHSFAEFYRRGVPRVGLSVDASNASGATRLYERAGMHVASEFLIHEKEYRPGREPEE